MALTVTPMYDENGNVIDPSFYVEGMATHAGQFNNGIDRDNMPPETITSADVDGEEFTLISDISQESETQFALDSQATVWQGGNGTDASGIHSIAFTLPQSAHVTIYWSGEWEWNGNYSWVPDGSRPNHTDTFDTIQIRATINGDVLFVLGPFEDGMTYGAAFGVGTIQLPAGAYTLRVEALPQRMIAQTMLADGPCTNTCTFNDRQLTGLARMR